MTALKARVTSHAADTVRLAIRLACGLTGHRWRPTRIQAVTQCQFCHAYRVEVREP